MAQGYLGNEGSGFGGSGLRDVAGRRAERRSTKSLEINTSLPSALAAVAPRVCLVRPEHFKLEHLLSELQRQPPAHPPKVMPCCLYLLYKHAVEKLQPPVEVQNKLSI